MSTKELDANWAPKRVQITEDRRAFYQNQWSAVGKHGVKSLLASLKEKILQLGGFISTEETIERIDKDLRGSICTIETNKREIGVNSEDVVINTMSCTVFSKLLGQTTELKYRGVILVFLDIATPNVLPKGVDFIYVDDKEILFNRVSNQNSF